MYVYCMFCETQRCKVIAKLMEIRGALRSFSPQIVRRQRKKGQNTEKCFDLLPGYVFVFSEERMVDYTQFFGMDGVIRRVGKQETGYELVGSDLDFAMKLFEKDGLVGSMKTCRVGDSVTLEDPLFNGCHGKITRIDWRKQRARVDFVFDNMACHTWIAVDGVKTDAKDTDTAMKTEGEPHAVIGPLQQ